jgi:hypothetical protein
MEGNQMSKSIFNPAIGLTVCLTCLFAGQTTATQAGGIAAVGKTHPASNWVPIESIDHSAWDILLKKYVDADGNVNYAIWKRTPADVAALDQYLASLSRGNPSATKSRDAGLAFWINAYNAVTIRGILDHYPTSSIRNHTAKLFGYNIWHDLMLTVANKSYSLDTIEHKILRPSGENRIHFAIVCASISCPRLRNEAYVPTRLEEQLTDNTRDFFSRSQNFSVRQRTANVSSILKWFAEDFGTSPQAGLASLAEYLPESGKTLVATRKFSVSYLPYDWGLNEQKIIRSARR